MAPHHSNLKLGRKIGNGHFGDVYEGEDPVHGKVAVKVMRQTTGETAAEWQDRKDGLLAEGKRLRQAAHTNVVRVHHLTESASNDAVHLVMEFCTGGSLQTAFEEGPMSLKKVMKVIRQTASGLHILHTRGMLHRDIKPGNLLQDRHGVTKLADFGLVTDKLLKGYASSAGYLDHLAYEVWHTGRTSVQSDIWALGMTMYRLLHGALWYSRAPDPKDVIINGGFADTLNWLPHIPKAWRTLVKKMMSDDLDLRPKNAMQVLAALAKLSCEPNWKCTVRPTGVSWRRKTNDRLIRVRWTTHSPRKHEWRAWSEPLSTGRSRTLEESGGIITRTAAEKELRAFFAK